MQWIVEPTALDWVRERLAGFGAAQVTSLVPGGFEAYARVLYPPGEREQGYRWSDVAAWRGVPLTTSTTFEDIAVRPAPDADPETVLDGGPRGPVQRWGGVRIGPPEPQEAGPLVEVLRSWTDPGERCWFGVWEGYGWVWGGVFTISTDPEVNGSRPIPEQLPVPAHVRDGPRAWRPSRSYVLYTGSLDDALALGEVEFRWMHGDEIPDLWWPESRTWFVGADTDLAATYVGGPRLLIEALLAEPRLETQALAPGDRLG